MTVRGVRCLHNSVTTERISDHVKFAYWVPNVSGGLVTSTIEQRTDWGYDYNVTLARTAENNGFEYALTQVRYEASYGAEYQHESTSFSLALLLATERLKVIAAVHPGLWQPGVLAKLGATADHLSGGRFAVNVVSGWFNRGWSTTRGTAEAASSSRCCARSGPRMTSTSGVISIGSTTSR
jgi:FMNH2-dependent dimethyl sulfone monooxygenase